MFKFRLSKLTYYVTREREHSVQRMSPLSLVMFYITKHIYLTQITSTHRTDNNVNEAN